MLFQVSPTKVTKDACYTTSAVPSYTHYRPALYIDMLFIIGVHKMLFSDCVSVSCSTLLPPPLGQVALKRLYTSSRLAVITSQKTVITVNYSIFALS